MFETIIKCLSEFNEKPQRSFIYFLGFSIK